jgi:hypothetical protein
MWMDILFDSIITRSPSLQVSKLATRVIPIMIFILALVGAKPLSIVRLSTMVAGLFGWHDSIM